jgi:hypothetical protein
MYRILTTESVQFIQNKRDAGRDLMEVKNKQCIKNNAGKREGKKSRGRHSHRLEDNIKMNLI